MKLDFLKLRIACARKCWSVAEAFKTQMFLLLQNKGLEKDWR